MISRTELYGGRVILEFDSGKHQYRVVKGNRRFKVPSVTAVCGVIDKSGPLMAWAINKTIDVYRGAILPDVPYPEIYLDEVADAAKKSSRRIKQEAANIGTEIHKAIEEGIQENAAHSTLDRVVATLAWIRDSRLSIRDVERRVYSCRHRCSGTLDAIAEDEEGKLVLLDWKTGKKVYPEFRLQTAAYVKFLEEETGDKIDRRIIVRIPEIGPVEPHLYPLETLRHDWASFIAARNLHRGLERIKHETE